MGGGPTGGGPAGGMGGGGAASGAALIGGGPESGGGTAAEALAEWTIGTGSSTSGSGGGIDATDIASSGAGFQKFHNRRRIFMATWIR